MCAGALGKGYGRPVRVCEVPTEGLAVGTNLAHGAKPRSVASLGCIKDWEVGATFDAGSALHHIGGITRSVHPERLSPSQARQSTTVPHGCTPGDSLVLATQPEYLSHLSTLSRVQWRVSCATTLGCS